jgi:transglutaminase/protease-like cytokinesis protein 3
MRPCAVSFAGASGLQSFVIQGNAKGWGSPKYPSAESAICPEVLSNHCWLAVYLAGGWHLIDIAWAAGHFEFSVGQRRPTRYRPRGPGGSLEQFWLIPPQRAIADHCPEDPAWQLLPDPVSQDAYERAVYRTPAFFAHGLGLSSQPDDGTVVRWQST